MNAIGPWQRAEAGYIGRAYEKGRLAARVDPSGAGFYWYAWPSRADLSGEKMGQADTEADAQAAADAALAEAVRA